MKKTVDVDELADKLKSNVKEYRSIPFLCCRKAAFESWFRIEIIPSIMDLGIEEKQIETNYKYPFSKGDKADLAIRGPRGLHVMEMMCFVANQDSNKKEKYLGQVEKLEKLIKYDDIVQVLTFTTFIGYTEQNELKIIKDSHRNDQWVFSGFKRVHDEYPLKFIIGSLSCRI